MTRIAILVSGGGTNLQSLIDAWKAGKFINPNDIDGKSGEIVLVVSSKHEVYALQRASDNGIPAVTMALKDYHNRNELDAAMLDTFKRYHVDLVITAGYLSILGPRVLAEYQNRIMNIHPALIPSFSGKGFYGLHVHKAALDHGVKVTGATVHFVNEVIDGGKIIVQKAVDVLPDDTPETLQRRVMEEAEWEILPKAVAMYCCDEI